MVQGRQDRPPKKDPERRLTSKSDGAKNKKARKSLPKTAPKEVAQHNHSPAMLPMTVSSRDVPKLTPDFPASSSSPAVTSSPIPRFNMGGKCHATRPMAPAHVAFRKKCSNSSCKAAPSHHASKASRLNAQKKRIQKKQVSERLVAKEIVHPQDAPSKARQHVQLSRNGNLLRNVLPVKRRLSAVDDIQRVPKKNDDKEEHDTAIHEMITQLPDRLYSAFTAHLEESSARKLKQLKDELCDFIKEKEEGITEKINSAAQQQVREFCSKYAVENMNKKIPVVDSAGPSKQHPSHSRTLNVPKTKDDGGPKGQEGRTWQGRDEERNS